MRIISAILKDFTSSDKFITLPPTTQLLFFHLCQSVDVDGFTDQVRSAMFKADADDDDLATLINKGIIESGLDSGIYIADWIWGGL